MWEKLRHEYYSMALLWATEGEARETDVALADFDERLPGKVGSAVGRLYLVRQMIERSQGELDHSEAIALCSTLESVGGDLERLLEGLVHFTSLRDSFPFSSREEADLFAKFATLVPDGLVPARVVMSAALSLLAEAKDPKEIILKHAASEVN